MTTDVEKKSFRINRQAWVCGGGSSSFSKRGVGYSELLNNEGYMCCLGQLCMQLDYSPLDLYCCAFPRNATQEQRNFLVDIEDECGLVTDSDFSNRAISINDNPNITNEEREKRLTALAEEFGISLTFYDGPPTKPVEFTEKNEMVWESPLTDLRSEGV